MVRVAADPPFEVLSVKEDPAVTESEGKTTGSTDRSTTEFTEEIGRTEVIRLSSFNEIEKSTINHMCYKFLYFFLLQIIDAFILKESVQLCESIIRQVIDLS